MSALPVPTVLRRALLLLVAGLLALPAFAAEKKLPAPSQPYEPPVMSFPEDRITLIEAVRLTLQNDPNLKLEQERSRGQEGAAQVQTGAFDSTILGNASFSLTQSSLTQSQVESEQKKRDQIRENITKLQSTNATAQQSITGYQAALANPTASGVLYDEYEQAQLDLLNTLIASEANPSVRDIYLGLRNDFLSRGLTTYQQILSDGTTQLANQQKRLADLGDIPKEQQQMSAKLDLRALFPYRDGVTLGLFGTGSWDRDRYKGKEKSDDPTDPGKYGGKGIEDVWSLSVGFSIDAKLLRGRGTDATGAFEKAALIDYDASRDALRHAASTSVLNTAIAYWNLVAAQERLRIARQAAQLQGKVVEITDALIAGDELPRAESARVLASQATYQGLVFSAEREVNDARIALARTIGLGVLDERNAPLAADPFPPVPDQAVLDTAKPAPYISTALERRYDRRAALKLVDSGGVLVRQAQTALRPRLDLAGQVSAGSVAETSLSQTAHNWSAPSFNVGLVFEMPVGNNVARGQLLQNDASLNQRGISAADLERGIKAGVVQTLRSLQQTAEQAKRTGESVTYYQRTIEAEGERYRAGQSSLLDAITTQDLQTSALFSDTAARQQFAQLIAQLRFDTGTLVTESGEANAVRAEDLVTLPAASGK